jgi:4-hydroxybenzoate polyprenyltransferase
LTLGFLGFVRLSRPHFLFGGALMYGMGVASGIPIGIGAYLIGQAMVSAAQVTAHYVNEYADVEADRLVVNRTFFSGGSGVFIEGQVSPHLALRYARISSALAMIMVVVVGVISLPAALLGLLALGVSWAYSMPPFRLLDTGWGELATSLVVTVLVPLIGSSITQSTPSSSLVWAMAVLFPVHLAMMLIFEIPDAETDRVAGKTVLLVRIGEERSLMLIKGLFIVALLIATIARPEQMDLANLLPWLVIAVVGLGTILASVSRRAYAIATGVAVAELVLFGSLFLLHFVK